MNDAQREDKTAPARGAWLIAGIGFVAIVSQTLLFRLFLTVFEGNEISIAAFFASWLIWIAAGAALARMGSLEARLSDYFPLAPLAYVPAYLLQMGILYYVRDLAGVQAYESFPMAALLVLSVAANAPVSVLTGFLFTAACRWTSAFGRMPVARVYMWETFGGAAGGLTVTLLLWMEMAPERIILAGFALLGVTCAVGTGRRLHAVVPAGLAVLFAVLSGPPAAVWTARMHRSEWARLFPADTWRGAFTTAQNRYLYGLREGQFIIATGGGVCESLPPTDHDSEVAAIHLAQKPDAARVLVFGGNSLGIGLRIKTLPQIERVTWLHPDPQYPAKVRALLKEAQLDPSMCPDSPGADIRRYAAVSDERYDLVILNLPDITTLVLNRYCTEEFFAEMKGLLAENGVLSVRVSGPANYIGREVAALGAAMYHTLARAFADLIIKPGDETWLIATDGRDLQMFPPSLRTRFERIPGASNLYPPENIPNLFPPERADQQYAAYRSTIAELGEDNLVNTDRAPRALFYTLLLAIKQAGYPVLASHFGVASAAAAAVVPAPIWIYALLRLIYLLREHRPRSGPATTDAAFLIFSTGLVSMAFNLVLMFMYQVRFGTLFLDVGLVSALFMLGAFLGGAAGRFMARYRQQPVRLVILPLHAGLLLALVLPAALSRPEFAALFLASGFFTGIYFPLAAADYGAAGRAAAVAGSNLEVFDTVGGGFGAVVTGLVMLPVLGHRATLAILAALTAANLPPIVLGARAPRPIRDNLERLTRPLGYLMAGIAIYALAASQSFSAAARAVQTPSWIDAARALARTDTVVEKKTENGITYYEAPADEQHPARYIFDTAAWGEAVAAYGGSMRLAVCVAAGGELIDYKVLQSNETPAYLYMVESRKDRLVGRNLFEPEPFKSIDTVSGATTTDTAIKRLLETSGRAFAERALNRAPAAPRPDRAVDWRNVRDVAVLGVLLAAAIGLRYVPHPLPRQVLLLIGLVVTGFWLNLQYSTHQIVSLTDPVARIAVTGSFFLMAAVPVAALVFGNIYCGYLCPFGAAQEWAQKLTGGRFTRAPSQRVWRYIRGLKYVLLFVLVMVFAISRDLSVIQADPLVTLFSGTRSCAVATLALCAVAISAVFTRFWCRNFCPVGAFLSLLSGIWPVRRFVPARVPHRCDLGVRDVWDYDCIHCDRCRTTRYAQPAAPPQYEQRRDAPFVATVIVVLAGYLMLNMPAVRSTFVPAPSVPSAAPAAKSGLAGQPRNLDVKRIQKLIEQGRLSDHPADFHK